MICCEYIGKGNDYYHCHTYGDCDFCQIMGYNYHVCSHCYHLSSMSPKSSLMEFIKFSINTIKKNINKKRNVNLYKIRKVIPEIINNCLVYI